MPILQPIQAIFYDRPADGDISAKIAPPYDVLDEQPKRRLLDRDSHNIVAIDLPVTPPKTVGPDSAYEQAGQCFEQWLEEGILERSGDPVLVAYEQKFEVGGADYARRGLFAVVEAEPFNRAGGGVFRHEMTIPTGTEDRLKLMEATSAQLSPVFGVYADPEHDVAQLLDPVYRTDPDLRGTTTHDQVEHRCWVLDDPTLTSKLEAIFRDRDVYIADGHHRYTTALNYQQAHGDAAKPSGCLMVLVCLSDPGMIVLPTHRLITGLGQFSLDELAQKLAADGRASLAPISRSDLTADSVPELLQSSGHHAMLLLGPGPGEAAVFSTTSQDPLADLMPDKPSVWRTLDVAVAHELLIDRILRPHFGEGSPGVKYTADLGELQRLQLAEPGALGVVLQPTTLEAVCAVAAADEVMPPKSTFFFPKLATGLVIHNLR
ncbi:MAG: DUF1015 domain-containing protein [Phycisphaerae bacterium]|nr:DUF1015 domain-containing protein [Phycisphaerae bacterium]